MNALAIFKDKATRTGMLGIAIPVALQGLITYCTGMMDTVMLGQLGEVELSGAATANQFSMIFMGITFGIASGTSVLLSQYWGKGDTKSMGHILSIMYWVSMLLAMIFCVSAFCFPEQIITLFIPDAEVVAVGAKYLKILAFSYLGMGISNVILMTLRSVGTVKISVVVYLISLFVNTGLNYVLIFGKLGLPALGVQGAAIATCISRTLEAVIAIVFMFRFESKIRMKLKNLISMDLSFIKDLSVNVMPVICNEMLWSLGNSSLVAIMGHMGRTFITANTITNLTVQLTLILTFGLSNATSVTIGNAIGAQKCDYAKTLSRAMMTISVVIGIFAGVVIYLIRPIIISFYNIPAESKEVVMAVMASAALVVIFQTISITEFMGVLRGGGDNIFVLVGDIVFMWIIAIPLGAFVGLYLAWPPAIVYLVLKIDEVMKIICGTYRICSDKWVKNLTR